MAPSSTRREIFELRLARTHVAFGLPAYNLWWANDTVADLGWSQGVVQFGSVAYRPLFCEPAGSCGPTTFHYDNVVMTSAVPFTILRGDRRTLGEGTPDRVTFAGPAPAGAQLKFTGMAGSVEVSLNDGQSWQRVSMRPQPGTNPEGDEHPDDYAIGVPAGTTSVRLRGTRWCCGPLELHNFALYAFGAAGSTPTPTPIPQAECVPRPRIVVSTVPSGAGRLQVTVVASKGALRSIRFAAGTNARIDIGNVTNQALPLTWTLPTPGPQTTFVVRRMTNGQSTTVPLVVTADCGDWSAFVGGGPTAF